MIGPKWDAVIERYIIDLPEEVEMDLLYTTCFNHPAPHSTFEKHIWGSELVSNRYFAFFVSDSNCKLTSAAEYRPRRFYGWAMGGEWDAALQKYWKMRRHARGVKETSAQLQDEMPDRFPGPDPWLKYLDSEQDVGSSEPKKKLKVILPPPPTTRPKRRRRPSDPAPGFDAWLSRRRNLPFSLPPSLPLAANSSGGKVLTQPLESQALANARALYREATPELFDDDDLDELVSEDRFHDEDKGDSEEDAKYSDEDIDEDENMRLAIKLSKQDQAERERRRDSGGSDVDAGVGPAPKEEKEIQPSSGDNKMAGLPFPTSNSGKSPPQPSELSPQLPRPSSSMLPPPRPSASTLLHKTDELGDEEPSPILDSPRSPPLPTSPPLETPTSPRSSSSMLPPPSPRPSSSMLPPQPPSPRPSQLLLPPPPSTRPAPPALPPVVLERKRKFRVIDLDADPDLDEEDDSDSDDDQVEDEDDEDIVMEDADDEGR